MYDANDLSIIASTTPARIWDNNGDTYEEYVVFAFLKSAFAGYITIDRKVSNYNIDEYYTELETGKPKPLVYYMETEEAFRGNGLSGAIIKMANDFYGDSLGTRLYSPTHFIRNSGSKRVWEKLENERAAEYEPATSYKRDLIDGRIVWNETKKDRWIMK